MQTIFQNRVTKGIAVLDNQFHYLCKLLFKIKSKTMLFFRIQYSEFSSFSKHCSKLSQKVFIFICRTKFSNYGHYCSKSTGTRCYFFLAELKLLVVESIVLNPIKKRIYYFL